MNPIDMPKTRSVWPTLWDTNFPLPPENWPWIGIFKPAEPCSPWDASSCLFIVVLVGSILVGFLCDKQNKTGVLDF